MRSLFLIARFGIQKKLAEDRNSSRFSTFQKIFSSKMAFFAFLSIFGIIFIAMLLLSLTFDATYGVVYYSLTTQNSYECVGFPSAFSLIISLFVIFNVALIIAAVVIRAQRIRETLGFKTEILFAAIFQAIVPPVLVTIGATVKDRGLLHKIFNSQRSVDFV